MASSSTATAILNVVSQYPRYSSCTIFFVGVVGNALNILAFSQLKLFRRNRCAFFLVVESIINTGYLIVYVTNNILMAAYGNDPGAYTLVWCRMRSILYQTVTLVSSSIVCFAACDQFCSTNHRFYTRQLCTLKLAKCLTFIAVCIWLVHSIAYSIFLNIQPSSGCILGNEVYIQYSSYFFFPVLNGLLPIVVSSIMSLLSFRNVRRIIRRQVPIIRRRLDRQMTAMILTRVVFFVILSLPFTVYRIYSINFPATRTDLLQYALRQLVQTVLTSSFALNFAVKSS